MDRHERYLQNLVRSASPARLRLLLIERAIEVAESLANSSSPGAVAGPPDAYHGKNSAMVRAEQTIRLREILGELLNGVVNKELDVAKQVADLYVFLLQFLGEAERDDNREQWVRIADILRIEQETWSEVCDRLTRPAKTAPASGPAPAVPDLGTGHPVAGSLNLQG
ncbi:MAG: flagellar protein FliS [Pirellulaceae bacterium]